MHSPTSRPTPRRALVAAVLACATTLAPLAAQDAWSLVAVVDVPAGLPPVITRPPERLGVRPGERAVLRVEAASACAPTYRWTRDGVPVPGGDRPELVLDPTRPEDAGLYAVTVSSPAGSVVAGPVRLGVTDDPGLLGLHSLPQSVIGSSVPGGLPVGGVDVVYDATGLRPFRAPPPPGEHPRIFVDDRDRAEILARLTSGSPVAAEALRMIRAHNMILRGGRAAYLDDARYPASDRVLPSGAARIGNIGLIDRSAAYLALAAGDASQLPADNTGRLALAGQIAIEAFTAWLFQDQPQEPGHPPFAQRRLDAARAIATWAASIDPATLSTSTRDNAGGVHLAHAYDFTASVMTEAQRAAVRACLARMIFEDIQQVRGVPLDPAAATGNWIALDGWNHVILMAFEGEAAGPETPGDDAFYAAYFRAVMEAHHKYYTHGYYPSGTPWEGLGKNFANAALMIAYARRGYNFFAHPHVRAFATRYLPAISLPWGFGFNTDDQLGGTGLQPERGSATVHFGDPVGFQWAFRHGSSRHPAVEYVYRNALHSEWKSAGTWRQQLDFTRFSARSTYYNDLLLNVLFAQELDATPLPEAERAAVALGGRLDFASRDRGQVIARGDFSPEGVFLNFSARQDFGGHTHADRNQFTLAALGRVWFHDIASPTNSDPHHPAELHSVILVDDAGPALSPQEGVKARQPSRLAAVTSGPLATASTGDATYAYSWSLSWGPRTRGTPPTANASTETFNLFRHPDHRVAEPWGDVSFWEYPYWNGGGQIEAVERVPSRPYALRQVHRSAVLVRGPRPYLLVVDDVQADDDSLRDFKWLGQVASDLAVVSAQGDDLVLGDADGRRLLVRVLQAEGTPVQWPGSAGSANAYVRSDAAVVQRGVNQRLVIERDAVVNPRFKVLLYPHRAGDPLPATRWVDANPANVRGAAETVRVELPGQDDTITFVPRAVALAGARRSAPPVVTEFAIARAGQGILLDHRGAIIPMPLVRPSGWQDTASAFDRWADSTGTSLGIDPRADNDRDGVPALLAYGLGATPGEQAAASLPAPLLPAGRLAVRFETIADPTLTYHVDASGSPDGESGWTTIWTSSGSSNAAGPVVVEDPLPPAPGQPRFLRLRVSLP